MHYLVWVILQYHFHPPQVQKGLKRKGDLFDLVGDSGRVWGRAVLTGKDSVNPVFVSVGHKISLETASELTLAVSCNRIPEPVRQVRCYQWEGVGQCTCACVGQCRQTSCRGRY